MAHHRQQRLLAAALGALCAGVVGSAAQAAMFTWTQNTSSASPGTDHNWSATANWSGAVAPPSGGATDAIVYFNAPSLTANQGTRIANANNDLGELTLQELRLGSNIWGGVTNPASSDLTINLKGSGLRFTQPTSAITLNMNWQLVYSLQMPITFATGSATSITSTGGYTPTVRSAFSGTGALNFSRGKVFIQAPPTGMGTPAYTGNITVGNAAGGYTATLALDANNAFGSATGGTITVNPTGTLQIGGDYGNKRDIASHKVILAGGTVAVSDGTVGDVFWASTLPEATVTAASKITKAPNKTGNVKFNTINGSGDLEIINGASLTLGAAVSAPAYTGNVKITNGVLALGETAENSRHLGANASGTQTVTIESAGRFSAWQSWNKHTINQHFVLNGGIFEIKGGTPNLTDMTNVGAIVATANSTINLANGTNGNPNARLTRGLGGTGDISKTGAGQLVIPTAYTGGNGASAYSGTLTITAGTLQLGNADALGTGSLVLADTLAAGAVYLNYTGTEKLMGLKIGNTTYTTGTFGGVGSGATYENAIFRGTGLISVPEPTVMMVGGIVALAALARRKHQPR